MTNDTQSGEVARLRAALQGVKSAILHDVNSRSVACTIWMPSGNETMVDFIDAALAEQPTGLTDSNRLDWLSKQDVNTGRIGKDDTDDWEFVGIEHYALTWPHPTDDLREAIDAAMDSAKGGE